MTTCKCGCGQLTQGGDFLPGHDTKLRIKLEEKVGGLLVLEKLVDVSEKYSCGEISGSELTKAIRQLLRK